MPDTDQEEIVEALYDVVSSPDKYDAFMVDLQRKLETMRDSSNEEQASFISGHLKRAASLVEIVTPWRRDVNEELHNEIAQRMQAALIVDEHGHIMDANTSAKLVYDLAPGTSLADLPINEDDLQSLTGRLKQALTPNAKPNRLNDILRTTHVESGRPILFRVQVHDQDGAGQRLAILRTSDVGWPSHLGPILQDLFNLTRAEIDVTRLIVEGEKVREIARRRSASVPTVRSQIRALLAKTQTRDQPDFIRMVYGLTLMHDVDEGNLVAARIEAAKTTQFFPREDQRKLFKLPDGRQIEYSDFGAPNGQVILFNHDQAFGDVWFKEAHDEAIRRRLRIIGPLRPGFGQTTKYDGPYSDPNAFAPDVVRLLDHLDIDNVTVLALSSGLVHSLALAALIPDRIKAITACHPLLPVINDADLEGTNGYNYLIPHARLHFPASLPFLCKAGFAFVMRSGPAAFGKAVMRASPRDVEWITRPDILPVMIHGRRVHRDQGYIGNFGDLSFSEDWRPLMRNCPVPVRLVIGEWDRNVQWGPAKRWSAELEHVDLHVLPDSGYMVHHQRYETILNWLEVDLSGDKGL